MYTTQYKYGDSKKNMDHRFNNFLHSNEFHVESFCLYVIFSYERQCIYLPGSSVLCIYALYQNI